MSRPVLLVHGGAGQIDARFGEAVESGCRRAVGSGWAILERGGDAVRAVVAAVAELENDPHFNAGLGSVLTCAGTVETDASVMEGSQLAAGACGATRGVRNPIRLAHAILHDDATVLLVGSGAQAFAREHGIARCRPNALITEHQRQRWLERAPSNSGGTVGAVAIDRAGVVAAATSTGGVRFKRPGRLGDSAIIGAGTYADNQAGAASATGLGEAIIRVALAKTAVDLLRDGRDPMRAARAAVACLAARTGAIAGVIVVDRLGRIGHAYNSPQLPRAHRDAESGAIVFAC
ncbi:MAG TPA: isoaspartyl peptidase/L-asparaginase [Candidatus Binatia bacterium]|nr:isoaspartyl peptidase/L-asparaginase [Candidatus Binatia bacterium]